MLLWSAFPPADWGWLAWVALVPLFLLVPSRGPRLRLYARRLGGGLVFWLSAIQWVRLTDPTAWLAWLAMALHLLLLVARLPRPGPARRLPAGSPADDGRAGPLGRAWSTSAPIVLTGFPWYYLGHSQHRFLPLIQIADFAGALGHQLPDRPGQRLGGRPPRPCPCSGRTARGPRLTLTADASGSGPSPCWSGGRLVYGAYRLSSARFRHGPRVALLQSNFDQRYKMGGDPVVILERSST